jgi:hypothetical protein
MIEKFKGILTVYSISPSFSSKTMFKPMMFVESYDTEDLTEDNEPKDLSFAMASDTANDFPVLKLTPESVPAGNSNPSCLHIAWRGKRDKHGPEGSNQLDEGSFKPFGG